LLQEQRIKMQAGFGAEQRNRKECDQDRQLIQTPCSFSKDTLFNALENLKKLIRIDFSERVSKLLDVTQESLEETTEHVG